MQNQLNELWARATKRRAKNIRFPAFSPEEKIRFKREAAIIEQTGTTDKILSFIKQADEAKSKGSFYVEGAANCSFLLFAVGATTVNPLFIRSPFELFINPLTDAEPEYKIVFAEEPIIAPEDEETEFDTYVLKCAVKHGIIRQEQLQKSSFYPPAHNYQFVYEVLSETDGNIVWYEQAIELLARIGGFTYAEADFLRRKIKGSESMFSEQRKRFLNHAVQTGYKWDDADRYFHYIFGSLLNPDLRLKANAVATVFGRKA